MRIKTRVLQVLTIVTWSMTASGESAVQAPTTVEQIYEAAEQFLNEFSAEQEAKGREVEYQLGTLDQRLSLSDCVEPLDVEFSGDPERTARATLLVSCQSERPWRMFLKANVKITAQGWVAARPIGRGEQLDQDMLERTDVVINQRRRSGYTDPDNMIGMNARRAINAGTAITPDMLSAPEAVARGDRVIISAGNGVFSIQTRGEAVNGGKVGEQISVINENSGRRVRARIVEPGRVEVNI